MDDMSVMGFSDSKKKSAIRERCDRFVSDRVLRRSARMPRSEERGGMAAHSEAEANSLLVYKSPAWKGGVLYLRGRFVTITKISGDVSPF